jgi:hypothetical protein
MENFSFYLTFKPEDHVYTADSKLILNKTIPLQLYLDDYEVALTEFSSTSNILDHRHYVNVVDIFPESLLPTLGYTTHTIPIDFNEEYINNVKINDGLMKFLYFSLNKLYYDYTNINRLIDKQVVIIFNFTQNNCIIAFDPSLKNYAQNLFKFFDNDVDLYLFKIGEDLHVQINEFNQKNNIQINLFMHHCFDTENPNVYKNVYNKLNDIDYKVFLQEYERNKSKLPFNLNGIKLDLVTDNKKNITGITLKQNSNDFKITFVESNFISHELKTNETFFTKPVNKIDMCIIECDLIPNQYFNNKLKQVIKVINFGKQLYNFNSNELHYYNVIKDSINSINITISFLNNVTYVYDYNKDNIHITLNFRKKNELE